MKSKNYLYLGIAVVVVILIAVLIGGKKSAPSQMEQFISMCAQSGGSYNSATKTCVPPKTVVTTNPTTPKPAPSETTITQPVIYTPPTTPAQPSTYPVHVVKGGAFIYYSPTTASDMIKVSNPPTNTSISSPYTVSGVARGSWYSSSGTAPVTLTNSKGVIVARGNIRAQSNTATNDWVPFIGTITFTAQGTGSSGVMIFSKNNAAGATASDPSVEILVSF